MPPGYPPFRHCHLFFYFFSIFCAQHISASLPATYTHSRQHILFGFFLLPERYAFIIFSFEVFSFFRKSPRFLPASAGRILPASFLSIHKSEPRVPACRPLLQIYHTYLTYKSQPLTFGSAGQHYFNHQPFPRRPPPSSDASGLPPFPFTLPQPSTPPISHFFFFFFLPPFFFFSFFSFFLLSPFSFFLLFIIFSLHFLFSRLFLSSFLFSFLLYVFLSNLFFLPFFLSHFFITSPCTFFCVHHPKGCKTERSSVSRSRGTCPWRGFGAAPRILFFFFFMYSFMYACFLSGRQADSGRGSGGCAYVKVHIKIT